MITTCLILAQIGVVQFHAQVRPETVYVGQQVSADALTLLDDAARTRLRTNPEYIPAEVRGVTVYDFPFDTSAIRDVDINGVHFRQYTYHRALFALIPGRYRVPASVLHYALPVTEGYYSRPKRYTLQSDSAFFVALPLPAAGRPEGFGGAVGQFADTMRTDGSPARVGDTFILTLRVNGVGNLDLLPRPTLNIDWANVVEGDERVVWDSAGTLVRGSKEFDWVVTPKVAGDVAIPSVRYEYFDPTTRQYAAAVTPSLPMTVATGTGAPLPKTPVVRDTIGDTPFPALVRTARAYPLVVVGASVLVLLLALGAWVYGRRRDGEE